LIGPIDPIDPRTCTTGTSQDVCAMEDTIIRLEFIRDRGNMERRPVIKSLRQDFYHQWYPWTLPVHLP
jgi:hypothetical protein